MKIDLFKLNNLNYVEVNEDIAFDKELLTKADIRDIKNCHVSGNISINYDNEISTDLLVKGTFVLPCAVTLEDVFYDFEVKIEENIGNFEEFYNKNKNSLDILPFIWENIVSEVPIRVVKDGAKPTVTNGDGWELVCDDESLRKE
jgi:uncharacterized protein